MSEEKIVIEGNGEILGRIASYAAKQALLGKQINVINCEKILVSGNRNFIVESYLKKRRRTKVRFPSNPDQIMKRTIRGMINYKSGRGALAFKKVRCYNSVPGELKNDKTVVLGNKTRHLMSLNDLAESLKMGRN